MIFDSQNTFDDLIESRRQRANAIEQAVETMLVTSGNFGVLVHEWWDDSGFHIHATLSADVPSMTIEYHITEPTVKYPAAGPNSVVSGQENTYDKERD